MTYFLRTHRLMAACFMSLGLAACSTDALTPPSRVDTGTRVGTIQPVASRTDRISAYPVAQTPGATFVENADNAAPADPRSETGVLRAPVAASPQALTVPAEGVDMDAMLGVAPASGHSAGQEIGQVVGLAQEENLDIAEGTTAQPVVTGIGGDAVTQIGGLTGQGQDAADAANPGYDPDLPPLTAAKKAQEEKRQAQFLEQQQRVMLQRRQMQDESQVAFLPRAENPLSTPDIAGQMPRDEVSCRQTLKKMGVEFRDIPRISNGPSCGIDYPIELSGLSGGIDVTPAVKLNCEVTVAFAKWVKNELAPAARARYLTGIRTIKPLGGYSCRTMNSQAGNPMSEHAHGNAIDVGKFVLKSGREIDVRKPGFFAFREKGLLKAVRGDSCKYFTTVLGPGSDPHHKDHFHFDLRQHKGGRHYCS